MTCRATGCHSRPTSYFKAAPRMIVGADGMYFRSDGRDVLDGTAGLLVQ